MDIDDLFELFFGIVGGAFILFVLFGILYIVYYENYLQPDLADKANNNCKAIGFDQYKDFKSIGFFPKKPIAVQCEYAEKYTDLGVRINGG